MLPILLLASLPGTDGISHDPLKARGVTVLYFILADCPVARKYSPEIARLSSRNRSYIVFEDHDIDARKARQHLKDFNLSLTGLFDNSRALSARFDIRTVPSSLVLKDGKVLYKGRIDDRFPSLGVERKPRIHDLREALDAIAIGKKPKRETTPVVGCLIR